MRSSVPGKPTPDDVSAVEQTEPLLVRLTPGTGEHELYRMIREQAERGIKDAEWDKEVFRD
ncbi:MAG TPA: hypothetical protein VGH23_17530 [Rhizomicrobium sp.]